MKILVFDIGGTSIKYGIMEEGKLNGFSERPTDAALGGGHIVDTLIELISLQRDYQAIGISTAGQVDSLRGCIKYANSNIPDYTGTPIRALLEERFHVPVYVENDVNCAAQGEAIYGAGKDYRDFLCLTYGTGIGGAIIMEKLIYHGCEFSAGEFGAVVTHGEAKLKGSDYFDGCYERYGSTTALVKMAMKYDPSFDNGRKIFENLDNPNIQGILDLWIDEILLGLSTIIHIFNPACIILGGGVMSQSIIIERINDRIGRFVMPSFLPVDIRPAMLQNTAGLLGAGYLAMKYAEKGL